VIIYWWHPEGSGKRNVKFLERKYIHPETWGTDTKKFSREMTSSSSI
jgi:hypothetical protein